MRGYGRCPEYSKKNRADDVGHSISDGLRTYVDKVMPRRGGHGLSWPPDSGVGLSLDGRTQGSGVGRFDQSTFRPTISQPPRRKRMAAGRVMTDSDMGLDVMPEGTQRGTPRKRALFGPGCSNSESPVCDVAEARTGWSIEDEFPEGARSPGVDLADVVACLEVEDFRSESGYGCSRNQRFRPSPRAGQGFNGFTSTTVPIFTSKTSWDQYIKCLRPLSVPMDGMV